MPTKKPLKNAAAKKTVNPLKPEVPSSWEFVQLAQASLDAADVVFADIQQRDREFVPGRPGNKFTFMGITVAFLYFRSVELALKAAIRERALATPEEIRSLALGHNLKALIERALYGQAFTLSDLGLDSCNQGFIERWSEDYANKWFEYHFGPDDLPEPAQCQRVAKSVVRTVAPFAQTQSSDHSDSFKAVWDHCTSNKRLVPVPPRWSELYGMLKNSRQKPSGGWEPPLPLILAAGDRSMPIERRLRFKEHLQWADQQGQLDEIATFLRSLAEQDWCHFGEV